MRQLASDEYYIKVGNEHRIIHRPTATTVEKWKDEYETAEFEKTTKGGQTFWTKKLVR